MQQYLIPVMISLFFAASVGLLFWSLFRFPVVAEPSIQRRVALAMGGNDRATIFESEVLSPFLGMAMMLARRFSFVPMRKKIRQDLDAAGNPNSYSVDEYLAICMFCGGAVAAATLALQLLLLQMLNPIPVFFMAGLGFFLPIYSLGGAARKRVARVSKKLPYTLDLVALMMAAGSTFTEAIDTIIEDEPDDDFNQELQLVRAEIELGTRRSDALRNMADRIPLETLRSIVGAINQAEMLGTPMSDILKTQSSMLRTHRSVYAEKLSASASLRILIPSMLILVAVVIALFGPIIIRWMRGELM